MTVEPFPQGRSSGWPSLDYSIVDGGKRPAPRLPLELLDEPLAEIIVSLAEAKGAPPDYVLASVLSSAASLIGNAVWVEAWRGWQEPTALWMGLVGAPSAGKSPACDPALSVLRGIENDRLQDFEEELRRYATDIEAARVAADAWKRDVETAHKEDVPAPLKPDSAQEPEVPPRPRAVVMDTTTEELASVVAANPKGLLVFRDELSGFLGGHGRYGGDADRPFYLEAYGGRPFSVDRRKNLKPIRIPRLTLSVLGGIQPDRLNSLLFKTDDDGLAARFMWVWPEPLPPRRPQADYDLSPLQNAFQRLDALKMAQDDDVLAPVVIPLENPDTFERWREHLYEREKDASGLYGSFIGKLPGMCLRLSALLALLANGMAGRDAPSTIEDRYLSAACQLIDDYFIPMALRVYGAASVTPTERDAASIAKKILQHRELTVNARAIRRQWGIPRLREAKAVDAAMEALAEAGWARLIRTPQRSGAGRPAKTYEVNPDVFC